MQKLRKSSFRPINLEAKKQNCTFHLLISTTLLVSYFFWSESWGFFKFFSSFMFDLIFGWVDDRVLKRLSEGEEVEEGRIGRLLCLIFCFISFDNFCSARVVKWYSITSCLLVLFCGRQQHFYRVTNKFWIVVLKSHK